VAIHSVILAAGSGSRLGGPKALLAWRLMPKGSVVPLAAAHLEARAPEGPVLVVVREAVAHALRRHAPHAFSSACRLLVSHAPDGLGMAGSITAAMSALSGAERVLLTPVDVPPASTDTVRALAAALDRPGVRAARPVHGGRGGHPVLVEGSVLDAYRAAHPPPLREVLCALGAGWADVAVEDPKVLVDLDTAADFARWSREHGGGAAPEPAFFSLEP
jgi:molybdenum cofactor cytidylyltransferase